MPATRLSVTLVCFSGYQFVHETMEDSDIRKLVEKMMDEDVTPILSPVPALSLSGIQKEL